MTIEEMRKRKKELGYTYEQIADLSGVPLGTVQKVFTGVTTTPRYDTIQALEKLFRRDVAGVREPAVPYQVKGQGEYTLDDYYALPDERRVELIDGVIYDMASPTAIHQLLITEFLSRFRNYIREKGGNCIPFASPMDVQLDCDDKTILQPDVLVVCDRKKIIRRCVYGAPDFVVEILSPSTKKKDSFIKLEKYLNAGVRVYWMVDPDKKRVIVYDFEQDEYPIIYGFKDRIPVRIFEEPFELDFSEINDYISFLYED